MLFAIIASLNYATRSFVGQPQDKESSIVSKWSNIATAMEPFQIEPSLDPDTQYLVPRFQTLELDDAIADINSQIEVLEVR